MDRQGDRRRSQTGPLVDERNCRVGSTDRQRRGRIVVFRTNRRSAPASQHVARTVAGQAAGMVHHVDSGAPYAPSHLRCRNPYRVGQLGDMPCAQRSLTVAVLSKPTGGFRPSAVSRSFSCVGQGTSTVCSASRDGRSLNCGSWPALCCTRSASFGHPSSRTKWPQDPGWLRCLGASSPPLPPPSSPPWPGLSGFICPTPEARLNEHLNPDCLRRPSNNTESGFKSSHTTFEK